jgi:hypothetical protein
MNTNEREVEIQGYSSIGVDSRPFADRGGSTNEHE